MRSGLWFLAACGFAGMILGVASAQERPLGESGFSTLKPASRRATFGSPGRFFSRGSNGDQSLDAGPAAEPQRPAAAAPAAEAAAPETNASPLRFRRNRSFPVAKPAGTNDAGRRNQNFLDELFRAQPQAAQSQATSREAGKQPAADSVSSGGERNADFLKEAGRPQRSRIRQTAATADSVNPFAAPKNDRTSATGAREMPLPTVQKTTVSRPVQADPAAPAVTGPQTPMVTVHWVKRGDVNVGQECHCQLHVTNSGKVPAGNVEVQAFFPRSVRLTRAVPAADESGDHLTWELADLAPGQQQVIDIHMIPSQRGDLATNALVTFTAGVAGAFRVTEPLLAVSVEGPEKSLVGEPASQIIKVSNPGTGVATNVTLEAIVPAGLEHLRGERLAMEIGSLNPGETRVVRLALAAVKGGEQVLNVEVAADGDIRRGEAKTISVIAPTLTAAIDGPDSRYVGRAVQYTVTVNNDSDVPSNNVRATYTVPQGYKFVRADKGGRHAAANRTVGWFLGSLEPGESAQRTVHLMAAATGEFTHSAAVTSEHGTAATAQFDAGVEATASLALQFVEREDPAAIGAETAFEVRVRNDGGKPAENVGLSLELPAGVKYQSARGPSDHLAENGLLVFKSIGRLDPGKTAVYRIYVVGTAAGSHRVRARVASDSIAESLIGEEQTTFRAE